MGPGRSPRQGRPCRLSLPFGLPPCLRKGPDGWSPGAELGKLISLSSLWPPHPKQLSQKEHWNSHFLPGTQESSWEPELSGPKSMVPGSSARSPSLEELRMVPHPKTLPLPWLLFSTLGQGEVYSSSDKQQYPDPGRTRGQRGGPVPYWSYQSHEAESPREPGMTGSAVGPRTVGFLIQTQGWPIWLQAPPWFLPTTSAPPKPTPTPGPATYLGNKVP